MSKAGHILNIVINAAGFNPPIDTRRQVLAGEASYIVGAYVLTQEVGLGLP